MNPIALLQGLDPTAAPEGVDPYFWIACAAIVGLFGAVSAVVIFVIRGLLTLNRKKDEKLIEIENAHSVRLANRDKQYREIVERSEKMVGRYEKLVERFQEYMQNSTERSGRVDRGLEEISGLVSQVVRAVELLAELKGK